MKTQPLLKAMLIVSTAVMFFFSCKKNNHKPVTVPTLTTTAAGLITQTSFQIGGQITAGNTNITARGVCWSTHTTPTTADNVTNDLAVDAIFVSTVSGLTANTTYYVRAYATNSAGTGYGNEVTVLTIKALTAPVLETKPATSVLQTTLTSGGTFTTDGGAAVTAKGVCWGIAHNPTIADSLTHDGAGTANYDSQVKNLKPNTTYYIRAYATNSVGTSYGSEVTVQTLHTITLPTVTLSLTSVRSTNARVVVKVTADGSTPPDSPIEVHYGVCYSTSPNPTIANTRISYKSIGTSQTDINVTPLVVNTKYYMRAYAFNSAGTAYSAQVIATTHYAVGDRAEGGIIFWLNPTDLTHGLVVQVSHSGSTNKPWDNTTSGPYVSAGALSTTDGAANTLKIVNKFGAGSYAAAACKAFNDGGYTDWFLPAIEQLKLYEKQLPSVDPSVVIGGNPLNYWWSSTENSGNVSQAWIMDLGNNFAQYEDKRREWIVLAMRAY